MTFYSEASIPVFLISVYAKNVAENLSKSERNELASLNKRLVESFPRRVRPNRV